jgi:hypothetical protein
LNVNIWSTFQAKKKSSLGVSKKCRKIMVAENARVGTNKKPFTDSVGRIFLAS